MGPIFPSKFPHLTPFCSLKFNPLFFRYSFLMISRSWSGFPLLFALLPLLLSAQKPPQINLVPNHSFEEFSDEPGTWYYSGNDFSRVSLYWTSPTAASPDLYA